jgi:hypothetical protein
VLPANAVAPSLVATNIDASFKSGHAASSLGPIMQTTIPPVANAEQVAATITWLLSDDAGNVNSEVERSGETLLPRRSRGRPCGRASGLAAMHRETRQVLVRSFNSPPGGSIPPGLVTRARAVRHPAVIASAVPRVTASPVAAPASKSVR